MINNVISPSKILILMMLLPIGCYANNQCSIVAPTSLSDNFINEGECEVKGISSEHYSNDDARNIHKIPEVYRQFGLTGRGVSIGIWDELHVYKNHKEFQVIDHNNESISSRVVIKDPNETKKFGVHATHVSGTITSRGVDKRARGVAPESTLHSYHFANSLNELNSAAQKYQGITVSNHSYGLPVGWAGKGGLPERCEGKFWWGKKNELRDAQFGKYTPSSHRLDAVLHNNPEMSAFFAAGNSRGASPQVDSPIHCYGQSNLVSSLVRNVNGIDDSGFSTVTHYSVAKNAITVGATLDKPDHHKPTGFTSYGPTADGRVKPDIVANGYNLTSTTPPYKCKEDPSGMCNYAILAGTSMATPVASGIAALANQQSMLTNSRQLFSDEMKASMINTAISRDKNGSPNYETGWGLLDAYRLITSIRNHNTDRTTVNNPFKSKYWNKIIKWEKQSGQANITITWLDEPGSAVLDKAAFYIRSPSKKIYYPWSLDPDEPTKPAQKCSYEFTPMTSESTCRRKNWDNVLKISIDPKQWETGEWVIFADFSKISSSKKTFSFASAKSSNLSY